MKHAVNAGVDLEAALLSEPVRTLGVSLKDIRITLLVLMKRRVCNFDLQLPQLLLSLDQV
ncbi:hypothetical protein D3C78_1620290 [compost metagenome]